MIPPINRLLKFKAIVFVIVTLIRYLIFKFNWINVRQCVVWRIYLRVSCRGCWVDWKTFCIEHNRISPLLDKIGKLKNHTPLIIKWAAAHIGSPGLISVLNRYSIAYSRPLLASSLTGSIGLNSDNDLMTRFF